MLTWRHSIDEVEVQGGFSIVVRILEVLMDELAVRGLRITRFVFVGRLCLDFLFAFHVWVDGLWLGRLLYLEATGQALPHLLSDFLNLNLRATIRFIIIIGTWLSCGLLLVILVPCTRSVLLQPLLHLAYLLIPSLLLLFHLSISIVSVFRLLHPLLFRAFFSHHLHTKFFEVLISLPQFQPIF